MTDQIRHNAEEMSRLADRIGRHAEHLESSAGAHTRNTRSRLSATRGRDPLGNAVVHGSEQVLNVIKQAERQLRQHLRDVQKGLHQMSRNHADNDKALADMISRIHTRSEAQDKARKGWTDRAKGPDNSMKPVTVPVRWKPGMPKSQFARKAQQLHSLGRRGELYKATNPVSRDKKITDDYKGALMRIISNNHKENPDLAEAARRTARSMHPDHVQELQAGGRDHWENIRMLHGETNTDIGNHQIWPKIRELPDGTPLKIKVKWK
ncbi:hypothetical protein ACFYWU_20170 [Streptomyces chrestomyceticus]|uniref:hypothetical protein n=1 Tax=Streptomyces chrestomyceticus TaxID=68185 RepID=UPI00368ACABD